MVNANELPVMSRRRGAMPEPAGVELRDHPPLQPHVPIARGQDDRVAAVFRLGAIDRLPDVVELELSLSPPSLPPEPSPDPDSVAASAVGTICPSEVRVLV